SRSDGSRAPRPPDRGSIEDMPGAVTACAAGISGSHFPAAKQVVRTMRLKSAIWVAAYIRRCQTEGIFAAVRRHGADEAGAIFIKVNRLDGRADLYGPAPQGGFRQGAPL